MSLNPRVCGICSRDISGNFFVFKCSKHVRCMDCTDSYGRPDDPCPHCPFEVRDSVRTPVLLPQSPAKVTYMKAVDLKDGFSSTWRCPSKDKIILGGSRTPTLTVIGVNPDFNVTHILSNVKGHRIRSGISIDNFHQLVNISEWDEDKGESVSQIYSVYLEPDTGTPQQLEPFNQLRSGKYPRYIFPIKAFRYGVYYPKDPPCRVEVYGLADIIAEDPPGPVNTIQLGQHTSNSADTLCLDNKEHILVSSYKDHVVFIYTYEGILIDKIGPGIDETPEGGRLWNPRSIQVFHDEGLVVTCEQGDIHVKREGAWGMIKDIADRQKVSYSVQTKCIHWVGHDDKLIAYRIGH